MIGMAPECLQCKNFNEDSKNPVVCKAFPDGIPKEIWISGEDHSRSYPGDHGIRFERRET